VAEIVKFKDKTPIEKARAKAKQAMMAQAFHIVRELEMTAASAKARLHQLAAHEISEWDCVKGIHEDCLQIHLELGLTELMEKHLIFTFAHFTARPEEVLEIE
jgi:hypothetical protein